MPPKPTPTTPANNSGIHNLSNGSSIIPSSLRPDGSLRKEIKVRPGYKPAEDVEVYKNRTAEGFRNRGKGGGVPGANDVVGAGAEEKLAPHKLAAAAGKNAKRREARRKAAADGHGDGAGDDEDVKTNGHGKLDGAVEEAAVEIDPEAEAAKEARKLAKKLRQARELKEKKEQGGDLLPEQFAKVIKIQELIRQLEGLGFDGEGERKGEKGDQVAGEGKSGAAG
ncbi:hypothetical protein LTR86_006869 [Recurvomyces mirabilis]|nr:hypothetical protein LTR86_006869 [Recurvomyces mirabilis]